jgi:hypothetical protein
MIYYCLALLLVVSVVLADDQRTCGTPHLTQEEVAIDAEIGKNFRNNVCEKLPNNRICNKKPAEKKERAQVCLWMHIIYDHTNGNGNVSQQWVNDQYAVFNSDFGGRNTQGHGDGGFETSFQFNLEGVTRTGNRNWFLDIQSYESQVTSQLAVDPCRCQQVYFSQLSGGLLGYCYLPNSFPACSTRHGCFNHYQTMPGGNYANYNLGQTVTHEVGHGFGLYHVFQGGVCSGCGGDLVCDTNPQRTSTSGCPQQKDSCNDGLQDNYHNFLDYSYDRCMCEFTEGQSDRMDEQIAMYRPGYLDGFREEVEAAVPGAFKEAEAYQQWNEEHPKPYGKVEKMPIA